MKKHCTLLVLLLAVILTGCSNADPVPETTGQEVRVETTAPETEEMQEPIWIPESDSNYVRVADYIPSVTVELPYASTDNFTGQTIYAFQDAYLRYGTVTKLMQVADELAEQGFYIKIWDAFRPYYAQCKLWEICPDSNFVSNP